MDKNLIEYWIHIQTEKDNLSLSAAWRSLCTEMGYRAGLGRLYEWRDGKSTPPPRIIRFMQRDVLFDLFGPADEPELVEWSVNLTPPERQEKA